MDFFASLAMTAEGLSLIALGHRSQCRLMVFGSSHAAVGRANVAATLAQRI
jgi:hypothetical protein